MARATVTTEEIAMVQAAWLRLRGLKPFRGQMELLRDVEEHLAGMIAARHGKEGARRTRGTMDGLDV